MLELKDLKIQAGNFRVAGVNLKIMTGSCHVLVGPTGSGKTLILESIVGLRALVEGKIFWQENDISRKPIEQRGISYVPQDLALFPHLTVRENIAYGLRLRKTPPMKQKKIVESLAESIGISQLLDRPIQNLSGGERQRTALARALASGNKLLLLDEPLSALHSSMKREIWLLLKKLQKDYDLTILMVTHDLEEAFFLGDFISILFKGKLVQTGTKYEVFGCPCDATIAKFLGVENILCAELYARNGNILDLRFQDFYLSLQINFTLERGSMIKVETGDSVILGIRADTLLVERVDQGNTSLKSSNTCFGTVSQTYLQGRSLLVLVKPDYLLQSIDSLYCTYPLTEAKPLLPEEKVRVIFPTNGLMLWPQSSSQLDEKHSNATQSNKSSV